MQCFSTCLDFYFLQKNLLQLFDLHKRDKRRIKVFGWSKVVPFAGKKSLGVFFSFSAKENETRGETLRHCVHVRRQPLVAGSHHGASSSLFFHGSPSPSLFPAISPPRFFLHKCVLLLPPFVASRVTFQKPAGWLLTDFSLGFVFTENVCGGNNDPRAREGGGEEAVWRQRRTRLGGGICGKMKRRGEEKKENKGNEKDVEFCFRSIGNDSLELWKEENKKRR